MKFKALITTKSRKPVAARFKEAVDACIKPVDAGTLEATLIVHENAVRGVQKVSVGEWQTRYNPKRVRLASKPGDPPNVDTGVFIKSIQFQYDKTSSTGAVGTNDERGPGFEFGTTRMKPRPWLGPAITKSMSAIRSIFSNLTVKVS